MKTKNKNNQKGKAQSSSKSMDANLAFGYAESITCDKDFTIEIHEPFLDNKKFLANYSCMIVWLS